MNLFRTRLSSGLTWWLRFCLLIAVPALLLALLGLRAARSERTERQAQLREQRIQLARLSDVAIATVIGKLENELRRDDTDRPNIESNPELSDLHPFLFHQPDFLVFYQDKTYFGDIDLEPDFKQVPDEWPVQLLIDHAETARSQRHTREALSAYARIIADEPRLSEWAKLCITRLSHERQDAAAMAMLESLGGGTLEGVAPNGLPVALFACAHAENLVTTEERRDSRKVIEQTLAALRSGRWWLGYETRLYYDNELSGLLDSPGSGSKIGADNSLVETAAIERIIRKSGPTGGPSVESNAGISFLVLRLPSNRRRDVWVGAAIARRPLKRILDGILTPLLSGQSGTTAIRDGHGNTILGAIGNQSQESQTVPLRSVNGWEMVFTGEVISGSFTQRITLWYGFIGLLVVMLMTGVAMTVRVVRREAELGRMQNEFIAGVSHELKSPIAGARLLLERFTGGRLITADSASQYHSAIGDELRRLERHVNRLLEAQQIQEERKRYNLSPASISEIIHTVVNELKSQAEAKEINIEANIQDDIPLAQLDQAAMIDAIENLLNNAIKYSRPGTKIAVTAGSSENLLVVEIRDQGIGIDRADLTRIFDRFYRGGRGNRENVRGTGLGLWLVKSTVEAHGGSIEVTSEPGVGSCFSLRVPIDKGAQNGSQDSDS